VPPKRRRFGTDWRIPEKPSLAVTIIIGNKMQPRIDHQPLNIADPAAILGRRKGAIVDMALILRADWWWWLRRWLAHAVPALGFERRVKYRFIPRLRKTAIALEEDTEHERDQLGDGFGLSLGSAIDSRQRAA
jgi:hypothetical protein